MVESNYPAYRWPGAPNPATPHLHNNVLQIAAERGLPCLAWWLWWVAAAMGDALREARAARAGPRSARSRCLVAVMVAGLFEYNFGDSEILMLLLIVCALPYALRRERGEHDPRDPRGSTGAGAHALVKRFTQARARRLVAGFRGTRVLVVGDVMLDEFLWGSVARISPEAPVPVVEVTHQSFHLGGAGNVANNVSALGGTGGAGRRDRPRRGGRQGAALARAVRGRRRARAGRERPADHRQDPHRRAPPAGRARGPRADRRRPARGGGRAARAHPGGAAVVPGGRGVRLREGRRDRRAS